MVTVTAIAKVSYEIPRGAFTFLRSVELQPGASDTMTFMEYVATEAVLSALKANGFVAYEAPLGNPIEGLLGSVSVANLATGGVIGAASATVDVADVALIDQTTAAQILALPPPSNAAPLKKFVAANAGSTSFTMLGQVVAAGSALEAIWSGSAWMFMA